MSRDDITIQRWLAFVKVSAWIIVFGVLLGLSPHAFANGTDLLSGTTDDATTTMSHTGKRWLYLIEGVASIYAYIKTKNIAMLGGIVVVAIMVNIILHFAGV